KDSLRADRVVYTLCRLANENAMTAWRVARSLDVIWSRDRHARQRGLCATAAHARPKRFFIPRFVVFDERHSDEPRSGLDGNPEVQPVSSASRTSTPAAA